MAETPPLRATARGARGAFMIRFADFAIAQIYLVRTLRGGLG
jgi:hypothetical protein